jgi:hypothetical protein
MVIRSLTNRDGALLGHDDGCLEWKPTHGRSQRTIASGVVTVMTAIRGPMGNVDLALIGTAGGHVEWYTLPRMERIHSVQIPRGPIRAITRVNDGDEVYLVGTQSGEVWKVVVEDEPDANLLFSVQTPISSLQVDGSTVCVRSGWIQHTHSIEGTLVGQHDTAESWPIKSHKRLDRSYPSLMAH